MPRLTLKNKKRKIEAILNVDEEIWHWVAEVYKPTLDKDMEELALENPTVEKTDLGITTRAASMKMFNSRNKRISHPIWKDWKDNRELKHTLRLMEECIYAIQNLEGMPLTTILDSVDVRSLVH